MASTCRYKCNSQKKVFLESLGRLVDCPECRNIAKVMEVPDEKGTSIYDKLSIPPQYKGLGVADQELFNVAGLQAFSVNSITEVANMLQRINKDLYHSKVTNMSMYFYTSNLVDVKRFIFGAQKLAIEKGLGVTPLISCNTLFGIQKAGDYNIRSIHEITNKQGELKDVPPDMLLAIEGYRLIQATDLLYFDFINADLCIVEATANTTEKGWTGLADLLGERSKRGLPTYVMGYWGSKAGGYSGVKGLKYLLAPEHSTHRLDLLTPIELKGKNTHDEYNAPKAPAFGGTSSSITSGITRDKLFG